MRSDERLALEYLRQQPREAAAVLGRLAPGERAAVLAASSASSAATVLAAMTAADSAAAVSRLDAAVAAAMLAHVGVAQVAAILRAAPETVADAVIRELPAWRGEAVALLIDYPTTVAGAWCDPLALAIGVDETAGDARDRIRADTCTAMPRIFIVDAERRVVGAVDAAVLLHGRYRGVLLQVAERDPQCLPARSLLREVKLFRCWDEHLVMPVVNRSGEFIGALDQAGLRRASATLAERTEAVTGGLGQLLADGAAGALQLALQLFEQPDTVSPAGGES